MPRPHHRQRTMSVFSATVSISPRAWTAMGRSGSAVRPTHWARRPRVRWSAAPTRWPPSEQPSGSASSDRRPAPLLSSCRQVLALGGLTLGVAAVTVTGLGGPAWADSAADVVLVPVGASPVAVLPGVGVQPAAFPQQLAGQVQHTGGDLPAGTEVAVTYDPRPKPARAGPAADDGRLRRRPYLVRAGRGAARHRGRLTRVRAPGPHGQAAQVRGGRHPALLVHRGRRRAPVLHVYELDEPTGVYAPAGIFRGTLKRPVPFEISLDLDKLIPPRGN